MGKLYAVRQDGADVSLDATEAQDAFLRGEIGFRSAVPVVDTATGEVGTIDPGELQQALQSGRYQLTGQEERREAEFQTKYGDQDAAAAGLGALRGLTFGLSDAAVASGDFGADAKEAVREIKERNEGASLAGEVVGAVAPALATGGGSLLARGGGGLAKRALQASPAALTSRLGTGAEALIKQRLGSGLASKVAQTAASGGIEGALYGAGSTVGELSLEDKEITAEAVLAGAGEGLLGGTLFGGAMPLGAAALAKPGRYIGQKIRSTTARSREALKRQLTQEFGEEASDELVDFVAQRTGVGTDDAVKAGTFDPLDQAATKPDIFDKAREVMSGGKVKAEDVAELRGSKKIQAFLDDEGAAVDSLARRSTKDLRDLVEEAEPVLEEITGNAKIKNVKRLFEDYDVARAPDEALDFLESIKKMAPEKADLKLLKESPMYRLAMNELELAERKIIGSATPEAAFEALDQMKRAWGQKFKHALKKASDRTATTLDNQVAIGLREMYDAAKNHLENDDIWGAAAAEMQRDVNAAWHNHIPAMQVFGRKFESKAPYPNKRNPWADAYEVQTSSVADVIAKGDRAANDDVRRTLDAYVEGRKRLVDAAKKHYDFGEDIAAHVQSFDDAAARTRSNLDDALQTVINAEKAKHTLGGGAAETSFSQMATGTLAGGIAGGIAGGMAFGPIGALAAGGAMLAANPRTRIAAKNVIEQLNIRFGQKADRAVKGFVRVVKKGRDAAKATGQAAKRARAPLSVEAFEKIQSKLQNPPPADSEELASVAPEVYAQAQQKHGMAVDFLRSKLPVQSSYGKTYLDRFYQPVPSDMELLRFGEYLRGVQDPMSVMDDIADGDASPEAIEAVKAVYPALFSRMQQAIMAELTTLKEPPPYEVRLQLGILFEVPADPSLAPAFIASMQKISQGPSNVPEESNVNGPPPKARATKPPELSGEMMSDTERLLKRRAAG